MTIFSNFDFDADRMEIRKCYGRTTDGQTDRDKYKRHLCVEKERVVESFLKVGGCDE